MLQAFELRSVNPFNPPDGYGSFFAESGIVAEEVVRHYLKPETCCLKPYFAFIS